MTTGLLKVATCQFRVGPSIKRNAARICDFIHQAKNAGADIVHFSECALSGYASYNFESLDGFDWKTLKEQTQKIMQLAVDCKLWVVLGSTHPLTEPNKPHNCLYLINPQGKIENRYDKRFCTTGDLAHYSPGNSFVVFDVNSVKCALLICFDLRFPEIYRELKKLNVQCIFQSFYNAKSGPSIHTHIMRQTMQCHAATNYFWVSMANTSGPRSPYPSCFIEPDGKIAQQIKLNKSGMMINTVDPQQSFYDASAMFRNAAMNGKLSNGPVLDDPRSTRKDIF